MNVYSMSGRLALILKWGSCLVSLHWLLLLAPIYQWIMESPWKPEVGRGLCVFSIFVVFKTEDALGSAASNQENKQPLDSSGFHKVGPNVVLLTCVPLLLHPLLNARVVSLLYRLHRRTLKVPQCHHVAVARINWNRFQWQTRGHGETH